tara:strand:+ start:789 stop:1355 length:567 start_codon:yes stop_codon:yes gene_type:complete
MIRIGLVGKIGSGKTFVGKLFKFPIFNADEEVKNIYKENKQCFKKLNKKFPKFIKSFPVSKSEIKQILNKKNIKIISKITHPYVRLKLKKFLKKNINKKYVVLDIPLLIENKLYKKTDILIYVNTSKKLIDKRLKKRGSYNKNILKILESHQLKKDKKIKLCNFIIENSLSKNNILKQIKKIKKELND